MEIVNTKCNIENIQIVKGSDATSSTIIFDPILHELLYEDDLPFPCKGLESLSVRNMLEQLSWKKNYLITKEDSIDSYRQVAYLSSDKGIIRKKSLKEIELNNICEDKNNFITSLSTEDKLLCLKEYANYHKKIDYLYQLICPIQALEEYIFKEFKPWLEVLSCQLGNHVIKQDIYSGEALDSISSLISEIELLGN